MANVVKTTVFLVDMADFAAMNTVYARAFGDHRPARSTVAVAALPRGARVEIEAVAALTAPEGLYFRRRTRATPSRESPACRHHLTGADRAWWSGRSSKPRRRRLRRLRWVRFPHAPATFPWRYSDRSRGSPWGSARSWRRPLRAAAQDSTAASARFRRRHAGRSGAGRAASGDRRPTRSRSAPARWPPSGARSCCPAGGRRGSAASSRRASSSPGKAPRSAMSLKTRHELAYLRRTGSARAEDKRREHEDWLVLLGLQSPVRRARGLRLRPPHRLPAATSGSRRCPAVSAPASRSPSACDERRTHRHLRFRHRRAHGGPRGLRAAAARVHGLFRRHGPRARTAPSRPRR